MFSAYVRSGAPAPFPAVEPARDGAEFHADRLDLTRKILVKDQPIGTVFLQSDMGQLHARLRQYWAILLGVFCASTFVALVLSAKLQRVISRPLQQLSHTATLVARDRDYSVRVARAGADELGRLTDAFNQMLAQIQARDGALHSAHGQLSSQIGELRERARLASLDAFIGLTLTQSSSLEEILRKSAQAMVDYCGLASLQLSRRSADPDLARSLGEIQLASERAAALTRQLLTFSHKQVIQCRALDLNVVLAQTRGMLQRMVGEAITLQWHPAPVPAIVRADLSNLEQVVMNLVINARDAMLPAGGAISLTLDSVDLPDTNPRPPDARPIVITISDTGCGMDAATLDRIFEPFFTTKPVGKGTGLGLAIVYGIVKQHHGWLEVHSAPGHGSTFRIFLPTATEPTRATIRISSHTQPAVLPGRGETILVAEDEKAVREFVATVLTQHGYQVLAADCGAQALEIWDTATQPIALLFTDMVMPNAISGSLLASLLRQRDPRLKIIYTSGYSSEMIAHGQPLSEGVHFLPKPFNQQQMLELVRRALHSPVETLQPPTATG